MRDPHLVAPKSPLRPVQKCPSEPRGFKECLPFGGAEDFPPFLRLAGIFCSVLFHGPWEKQQVICRI